MNFGGGPVLSAPKVQVISYLSDPLEGDIDSFVTELTQTSTWNAQTAEYGIGALAVQFPIHLGGTAPLIFEDSGVGAYLATALSGADVIADASTIYLVGRIRSRSRTAGRRKRKKRCSLTRGRKTLTLRASGA